MKEYKVTELSGGIMAGGINLEKVEKELNSFAKNGWILKQALSYSPAGPDRVMFIFEKEKV